MQDICKDAHYELQCEINTAHHAYDKQKAQFDQLLRDYESLDNQFNKEKGHRWEAEDKISCLEGKVAHYRGKAWASISMATSLSSSVKQRAEGTPMPRAPLATSTMLPTKF